jgi:aminoglycoside 3-N-acetyltransferase
MTEVKIITTTPEPRTRQSLAADLRKLGVAPGMTLLVHSSLSSLGWVNGGPIAVIQAFADVLTPEGTLVMPTHSGDLSDPALWENPPVPEPWWAIIRDTMPPFDPVSTPTRGMGRIPEIFRSMPGVLRSYHPSMSFAAIGPHAKTITANHPLDYPLGEESPLARIYDLDGWILLLGVGYDSNTSFHLAEYRLPNPPREQLGAPLLKAGKHTWTAYQDVKLNADPFKELGERFELETAILKGQVGSATCRLFHQRYAVDFALQWMSMIST